MAAWSPDEEMDADEASLLEEDYSDDEDDASAYMLGQADDEEEEDSEESDAELAEAMATFQNANAKQV